MFSPSQGLALYWLLPTTVLALNIPTDQSSINRPYLPSLTNITGTNVLLNGSSTLNAQDIHCDARWGEPPVASCADALAQVPLDAAEIVRDPTYSYGPRGMGTFDVGLPSRWISSDGKCIIDLTQTSYPSHLRYVILLGAVRIIQSQCVEAGPPPWGGQGTNLAQEENLVITTRAYRPPFIRCEPQPASARPVSSACATILETMKAASRPTKFVAGEAGPGEETLPQTLTEPTGRCTITVGIVAPDDSASWYDIWQAAVALDGMCARGGKAGRSRFLGAERKVTVDIKK